VVSNVLDAAQHDPEVLVGGPGPVTLDEVQRAACLRMGQLVNQTELGRDVALPQPTVHRWLNLLETSYLLVRLPA
jgi:predicted AAA+ superfamily ATPase